MELVVEELLEHCGETGQFKIKGKRADMLYTTWYQKS